VQLQSLQEREVQDLNVNLCQIVVRQVEPLQLSRVTVRENKCKSVTKSCKLSDLIVVQHQGVYGVFNFLFTLFFLLSVVSFASPTQEVLGGLQRDVMILEKRQYLGNIGSL